MTTYLGHNQYIGSTQLHNLEQARAATILAGESLSKAIGLLADIVGQRPDIEAAKDRLEAFGGLGGVAAALATIAAAEKQTEQARLAEITDAGLWMACTDRLSGLRAEIAATENQLARRREHSTERHYQLMRKGVTRQEADMLCPPMAPEEIEATKGEIAAMKEEMDSIGAFLADKPLYRLGLLRGGIADTAREMSGQRLAA